jgi:hypothetical protein
VPHQPTIIKLTWTSRSKVDTWIQSNPSTFSAQALVDLVETRVRHPPYSRKCTGIVLVSESFGATCVYPNCSDLPTRPMNMNLGAPVRKLLTGVAFRSQSPPAPITNSVGVSKRKLLTRDLYVALVQSQCAYALSTGNLWGRPFPTPRANRQNGRWLTCRHI